MPQPYAHSSTLAGRKNWVAAKSKEIVIPTVPGSATASVSTSDQAVSAAINHDKRVIYVDGPIDHIDLTAQNSSSDLRYLVFRPGGSLRSFGNVTGRNWRVTTEDPDHIWPVVTGSGYYTRCKFLDSSNVWIERLLYEGGQVNGGSLGVWENTEGNQPVDCGFQWVYHTNDDPTPAQRDFVLFGCSGYRPGVNIRSLRGHIYNVRSRNPGDFFQITSELPESNWNLSVSHPGFHIAGIDTWTDLYNEHGEAVMAENAIDLKDASEDPNYPVLIEDVRCHGYRRGVHYYNASDPKGGAVDDPGTAVGLGHISAPKNAKLADTIIWDSNIGVSMQPGYGRDLPGENLDMDSVLIHGADTMGQAGYAIVAVDDGAGGHDFNNVGIIDSGTLFAMDDPGFALRDSLIQNSNDVGNLGSAQSSGNLSNIAFRGASTTDAAGRLARSQPMMIEMPDPHNITSDVGVMHILPHALCHPDDAPSDNYKYVIGNEAPAGAGSTPVQRAQLTPAPQSTLAGATQVFSLDRGDETVHSWSIEAGTDEDVSQYFFETDSVTGDTISVTGLPTDGSVVRIAYWFRRTSTSTAENRVYYYTASSASLNSVSISGRTVEVAPGGTVTVPMAALVDIPAGRDVDLLAVSQPSQGAMGIYQQGAALSYTAPATEGVYVGTVGLFEDGSETVTANIRFVVKQNPQYTPDMYVEVAAGSSGGGSFAVQSPAVINSADLSDGAIVQSLNIDTGYFSYIVPSVGQHLHRVSLGISGSETAYLTLVARPPAAPSIDAAPVQTVQSGATHSLDIASRIHDPYMRLVSISISDEVGGTATLSNGVLSFTAGAAGNAEVELQIGELFTTVQYAVTEASAEIGLQSHQVVCVTDTVTVDLSTLLTGTADRYGLLSLDADVFGQAYVSGSTLRFTHAEDFAETQTLVVYARNTSTGEQVNAIVTVIVAPPASTTNGRLVSAHGLDLSSGSIRPDAQISTAGTGLVISWLGRRSANGAASLLKSTGSTWASVTEAGVFTAPSGCRLDTGTHTLEPGQGGAPTGWRTYTLTIPATAISSVDELLSHWGEIAWLKVERGNVQQHYWAASIGAGERLYDYYDDNDADIVGGEWIRQDEHHENLFKGYQLASDGNTTLTLPNREGVGYGGLLPAGFTAGLYVAPNIDADGYASFNGCETSVLMSRSALIAGLTTPLIVDGKPEITDLASLPTLSENKRRLMLTSGELVLLEQPL